ncbi:MAG: guanylyltransferase [Clostridia bacterium]|nr:guanylyltransferase [Clostridia bacterium]
MKFNDFDREMRIYEESLDQYILPDMFLVARLDGRSFTRLTKEICKFEAPFDIRFRDLMAGTVRALIQDSGFQIIYGYTQSDEISLLFHPLDNTFSRKVRKINTTLAGEASAVFSLALGRAATFDCRVVPLPNERRVADYFLWRQEDACRNSLNSHCYWTLRKDGVSARKASSQMEGMSVADKNELLFTRGMNFNDFPLWQKRGIGVKAGAVEKEGLNPVTRETVMTQRRTLLQDENLPLGEEYRAYILNILKKANVASAAADRKELQAVSVKLPQV